MSIRNAPYPAPAPVDGEPRAAMAQAGETRVESLAGGQQHLLVDLEDEAGEVAGQRGLQLLGVQRVRGQVEREERAVGPSAHGERATQHLRLESRAQAAAPRLREPGGRRTLVGAAEAGDRLVPRQLAGAQVHDRCEHGRDRVLEEREDLLALLLGAQEPARHLLGLAHGGELVAVRADVQLVAALAGALGRVHRRVGLADRSSAVAPSPPMLTPMEGSAVWGRPPSSCGAERAPSRRSAIWTTSERSGMPCSRTANSSPPRRAAVSMPRRVARRRSATPTSSSSPAAWPSVSLMALKSSRSTNATDTISSCRAARCSACSMRSRNSARFGRPVSGSCSARSRSWTPARAARTRRGCAARGRAPRDRCADRPRRPRRAARSRPDGARAAQPRAGAAPRRGVDRLSRPPDARARPAAGPAGPRAGARARRAPRR